MSSSRREPRRASGPSGYTTFAAGRRCRAAATSRRPRRPTCSRATSANSSQVRLATGDPPYVAAGPASESVPECLRPPPTRQPATPVQAPGHAATPHRAGSSRDHAWPYAPGQPRAPAPHTITQQDAPSPRLVTSHGWKRLIVELLSFHAAPTATPRRSSAIASSTSAHTGKKLVAGDHGARQRGQDHRALVVAEGRRARAATRAESRALAPRAQLRTGEGLRMSSARLSDEPPAGGPAAEGLAAHRRRPERFFLWRRGAG